MTGGGTFGFLDVCLLVAQEVIPGVGFVWCAGVFADVGDGELSDFAGAVEVGDVFTGARFCWHVTSGLLRLVWGECAGVAS